METREIKRRKNEGGGEDKRGEESEIKERKGEKIRGEESRRKDGRGRVYGR